ncbi:hypothetical protein ACW9HL_31620 [Nocardia gipuzkoensis]
MGELVDVLCASLIKRQIPVTEAERDAVANVLGQFNPQWRDTATSTTPEPCFLSSTWSLRKSS